MAKFRAFMTGTRVVFDDSGETHTEEHGWIDPAWSTTTLQESRNYVRPVAEWDGDTEEFATLSDFVRATVEEHLGAADDNGDGTFYGVDDVINCDALENGAVWSYALHFEEWKGTTDRGTAGVWESVTSY